MSGSSIDRLVKAARPWGLDFLMRCVGPQVVRYLAQTGVGSDECLKIGVYPARVDFYSPIPDITDLRRRDVWSRKSPLAGIEWREDRQLAFLRDLARQYGSECQWPLKPSARENDYFVDNGTFSFGCAAAAHCMIRSLKPARVIEVGSGNSTRLIAAALNLNRRDGHLARYLVIDPYAAESIQRIAGVDEVRRQPVEVVDPSLFRELSAGDILFIDSGHVVRVGGDVNFLYLDIVPTLQPEVAVHAHDIHLPDEYPRTYSENPKFRVFWTEAYLLQAFLSFNSTFEILMSMHTLQHRYDSEFRTLFPQFAEFAHLPKSGSFWFRRRLTKEHECAS